MQLLYFILYTIFNIILIIQAESFKDESKDLIVEIQNGKLKGKDNGNYYSYESIPYAKAPIGDLRFEAPQPYQQKWPGIHDASVKPKVCMQWNQFQEGENKLNGEEDCLTVNVYKPKSGKVKYPVVVYIHGGAFMFGAANDGSEDLLMGNGKVILVTMSYRLGPLGFLSTEDDVITGNFGLKDQKLALKWVKENIHNFGGDSEKILLMGFSAGGASTHLQLLQPTLQNIAKAVISLSGVALNPWVVLKNPRSSALKLAEYLQCPNTKDAQEIKVCLKNKKAEDIVTAVKQFLNFGYNPFNTFGPVVENVNAKNAFITEHPIDIIKSGNFSHLPWLASYAAQDGCFNAAELLQVNPKTGKQFINDLNTKWSELSIANLFLKNIRDDAVEYAKLLREKYLGNLTFSEDNYLKVQEMYTDILFKNGIQEALRLHSIYAKSPVYGYVYDNPVVYNTGYYFTHRTDIEFGTCHADDFNLILSPPSSTLKPEQQIMSQKLIQMLEDFVEKGVLTFDDCKFVNNVGNEDLLKLMLIRKNKCEIISENMQ